LVIETYSEETKTAQGEYDERSTKRTYRLRFRRMTHRSGYLFFRALLAVGVLLSVPLSRAVAQQMSPQQSNGVTIQGTVRDQAGNPVRSASVRLEQQGISKLLETTKTTDAGAFEFTSLPKGSFLLSAEESRFASSSHAIVAEVEGERTTITLVLLEKKPSSAQPVQTSSKNSGSVMEFSDTPNFTVAGVTDWTAAGGHGSDSALRTSEDLTRTTLTLKPTDAPRNTSGPTEVELRATLASMPQSFEANHRLGSFYLRGGRSLEAIPLLESASRIEPDNRDNEYDLVLAYKGAGDLARAHQYVAQSLTYTHSKPDKFSSRNEADLYRLAGEIDEQLGDPLAAVHEEDRAVQLDPSEENYFSWGSELLLHRAVWQATEVFKDGVKAYPKSARMLTGLGTSLFAGARYDEAALRLCEASDLNPSDSEPYIFLGKVDMAAPTPAACVQQRLARFLQEEPESSLSNYLYAMALWKRKGEPVSSTALADVEALLGKAVALDAHCVDGFLQLGIIASSQREYAKAISFYEKALEIDPQLGEAHYRLGVAFDRTGQPKKAQSEFLLHDAIERKQADEVEHQREQIKQFLVVLNGSSPSKSP